MSSFVVCSVVSLSLVGILGGTDVPVIGLNYLIQFLLFLVVWGDGSDARESSERSAIIRVDG